MLTPLTPSNGLTINTNTQRHRSNPEFFCNCCDCGDEDPYMLSLYFDPIQLQFRRKLIDHILTTFKDIPSMLNMISKFDHFSIYRVLNTIVKQRYGFDPRAVYYRVAPISDIFCDDILRHIVSFNEQSEVNSINKAFKRFSIKNETFRARKWIEDKCGDKSVINKAFKSKTLYMGLQRHVAAITKKANIAKRAQEDLKSRSYDLEWKIKRIAKELEAFFRTQPSRTNDKDINRLFPVESSIPFNEEVNDVWFVDRYDHYDSEYPDRKPPTLPVAKWRGPFKSLIDVLKKCKNGDKIYMHGDQCLDETIDVNVEIIGISGVYKECVFRRYTNVPNDPIFSIGQGHHVHFKNVKFECYHPQDNNYDALISIGRNAKLFMSDCRMDVPKIGINCNDGSFYGHKCFFTSDKHNKNGSTAIVAQSRLENPRDIVNDVFISDCMFMHFGNPDHDGTHPHPCIKIVDPDRSWYGFSSTDAVRINFEAIGNTFESIYDFPIGLYCDCRGRACLKDIEKRKPLKIEDNVLKGLNGSQLTNDWGKNQLNDANSYWVTNYECYKNDTYEQYNVCEECGDKATGKCDCENGLFYCWDCWNEDEDDTDGDENETKKEVENGTDD
eukprot:456002_1